MRHSVWGGLLLAAATLAGCGGGNLTGAQNPGGDYLPPPVPEVEILRREGLVVELETDKTVYSVGEPVRMRYWVTNTGTKTRVLDMHGYLGGPTGDTFGCRLYQYVSGLPVVWSHRSQEQMSLEVPPGEKICWVDVQSAPLAEPGRYDASVVIWNLYVDGQSLSSDPDRTFFQVSVRRGIQVQ